MERPPIQRTYRIFASIIAYTIVVTSLATPVGEPLSPDARLAIYAPRPKYPVELLGRRVAGSGIFLLRVHIPTGRVKQVIVRNSTGSQTLDAAAVQTLLQWRYKPGAVPYRKITSVQMSPPQNKEETLIKVPVTFVPGYR
jgi:TonB family protein